LAGFSRDIFGGLVGVSSSAPCVCRCFVDDLILIRSFTVRKKIGATV